MWDAKETRFIYRRGRGSKIKAAFKQRVLKKSRQKNECFAIRKVGGLSDENPKLLMCHPKKGGVLPGISQRERHNHLVEAIVATSNWGAGGLPTNGGKGDRGKY